MSNLSREYRIYLAIWRKAFRQRLEEDPVVVKASSYSMALSLRSGMYRAIRPFRKGLQLDEELRQAADLFVVSVEKKPNPQSPHELILKPRSSLSELEAELAFLGLDEDDLLLPEEASVNAALMKLLPPEKSAPAVELPPVRSNPFFTRD